jgi:hypothetical protein
VSTGCHREGNSARKDVSGRHDRLEVTFAHTKLRFQGKLVRVSDEHDVALIKVDAPAKIKPAPLAPLGSEREVQPGNPITILSYPDISLKTLLCRQVEGHARPGRNDDDRSTYRFQPSRLAQSARW